MPRPGRRVLATVLVVGALAGSVGEAPGRPSARAVGRALARLLYDQSTQQPIGPAGSGCARVFCHPGDRALGCSAELPAGNALHAQTIVTDALTHSEGCEACADGVPADEILVTARCLAMPR